MKKGIRLQAWAITPKRILATPTKTMLGALLTRAPSRSSCRTAARSFCAWDPRWKKKVRKHKLTKAKAAAKEHERLKGSIMRRPPKRKSKFQMPVFDQEAIGISEPDNVRLGGGIDNLGGLSLVQAFSATSSPFVYTATPPEQEPPTEQEEYWNPNRPAAVLRKNAKWVPFQPKDFGYNVPQTEHIAEVAFLGRSNVGKSSLMNALMGSKLARTSKQPGRTQLVNYYGMLTSASEMKRKVPDWRKSYGFIIDLPGYGFAVVSKGKQRSVQIYLSASSSPVIICLWTMSLSTGTGGSSG